MYAEFAPSELLPFLTTSQHYPLEAAYEVVDSHGLLHESVFLLSRMGNNLKALQVRRPRRCPKPFA